MSVIHLLRTLLFAVSFYGYLQYLSKKIKPELAVGVIFSFWGSVMFLAGTINFPPFNLQYACLALFAAGIGLATLSLKDVVGSVKRILTPGMVFFAVFCIFLFVVLYGSIFTYQDNYTHWAVVSRILLREDRFSLPTDTNVWFPSYPLGSSAFIYYVCKIIGGDSEWLQMFSQALLMAGTTVSVFAFARNIKGYILSAVTVIMLISCNIEITELLVDTLLPAVGVGAAALCIYYKDQLKDKILYLIPYGIFLASIKNSGLFFIVAVVVYALFYIDKHYKSLLKLAATAAAPFVAVYIWQYRVKTIFSDGLTTKHSMSLENFKQVFGDKTTDDVVTIVSKFFGEVFSFNNDFLITLAFIVIFVAVCRFVLKVNCADTTSSFIFAVLSYIGYQIGNLGMYLFTMPLVEALELASYPRYHKSILLFVAAIVCIGVLSLRYEDSRAMRKNIVQLCCCAVCAVTIWFSLTPYIGTYKPQQLSPEQDRVKMHRLIEDYDIPLKATYIIVLDDDYGKQMSFRHMARYVLDSEDVKARYLSDLKEQEHLFNEYEYLIIFHETEPVVQYITETFGENTPQVINLFNR